MSQNQPKLALPCETSPCPRLLSTIQSPDTEELLRFRGRQYDGTGVTVAIVDSGVQTEDPRLNAATIDGWTLELSATDHARVIPGFSDVHGHGTEIASALHQEAAGARLLAIRVADQGMKTSPEVIAAAVESAYREGARVVNVSLGASDTWRIWGDLGGFERILEDLGGSGRIWGP